MPTQTPDLVNALKRVPLLSDVSGRDLERLARGLTERTFPAEPARELCVDRHYLLCASAGVLRLEAQEHLIRAYATTGKYDEAEAAARRAATSPRGKDLWNTLGEVLLLRGKRAPAESAFVRAIGDPAARFASTSTAAPRRWRLLRAALAHR